MVSLQPRRPTNSQVGCWSVFEAFATGAVAEADAGGGAGATTAQVPWRAKAAAQQDFVPHARCGMLGYARSC